MAKRELFKNKLFGALIRFYNAVPVRREGMDWKAVALMKEVLGNSNGVLLFPEGTRQKKSGLGKARFGAGLLAQQTESIIVPIYIRGTDNLLDAFLRRRPMAVFYGLPITPDQYAGFEHSTRGQLAISEMILNRIASLQQIHEKKSKLKNRSF